MEAPAVGYLASGAGNINDIITAVVPTDPGYGKDVVWLNNNLTITTGSYLTTAPSAFPGMKTLIVEGNFTINSSTNHVTIGSATNPVIIIVNGNFTIQTTSGGVDIYGFIYADGTLIMRGITNMYGAIAARGNITIGTATAPTNINFTSDVYNALKGSSFKSIPLIYEVFN
jgi:hypothetical protein